MIQKSSRPEHHVSWSSWAPLALLILIAGFLSGCAGMGGGGNFASGTYHVDAYAPTNPDNVRVLVSLDAKMVYVMEGDRALLVTPCSIGVPANPTPTGDFRVTDKDPTKRSGEYGFWVNGSDIYSGSSSQGRPGYQLCRLSDGELGRVRARLRFPRRLRLAGAPLAWLPAHPQECLGEVLQAGPHRHAGDDRRQPARGLTLGRAAVHPSDYKDPDPPASFMISPDYFTQPRDSELASAPRQAPRPSSNASLDELRKPRRERKARRGFFLARDSMQIRRDFPMDLEA